jgi:hypothetical protein
MVLALSCPRCGLHRAVEPKEADFGVRCTACPEFMDVERSRQPGRTRERVRDDARPWTPWQILAASLVFGAGAAGAAAGFNFARLGKRQYLIPSALAGWATFLLAAALVNFAVPDVAARQLCLLANLTVGFGFMLAQQPFFNIWKAVNWSPNPHARYRPNGRGQLLLVCLVSLGLEIGVFRLLAFLAEGLP